MYEEVFFQLREGAAGLDIGLGERIQLLKDFVATVIKLIYAFLWQVKLVSLKN